MFPISTRVAGVTFDNPDGTPRQPHVKRVKPGDTIELRREPDNGFDANAIAVSWRDEAGELRSLGYVPRALAAVLAPLADEGMPLRGRAVRAAKVPRRGHWAPLVWGLRIEVDADGWTARPALRSGLEPAIARALAEDEATPDPGYAPSLGGSRAADLSANDEW
ncbi:MAG: HIRAN domain-containing protein [Candidatus Sericytochromatia bacterium]|nr:HIRAN domain-containing protein [Candidatus Sericytochromatia bacterium]